VTVTATLSHSTGHDVTTSMSGGADTSGSKNAIQALGSSVSYLKRYTASALLNLTSHGSDDDGYASSDSDAMAQWRERISLIKTVEEADRARADLMASTKITNEERVKIGHVWTAKRKVLKEIDA